MEKKYKLTDDTLEYKGVKLHRIEALKDFGDVKKGDKGGYIEKEENLSQDGICWVYGNAEVYGNAKVCENAKVYDEVWISDNAKVYGDAEVSGNCWIYGNVIIK